MTVIVTTNEPKKIKQLFEDRVELPMGFDFKLYTESGTVGIERKAVPGDLLASIEDGRLKNEILAMRDDCDFQVILLHGTMRFDKNDRLMLSSTRKSRWTKTGIRNLCRTLEWVENCYIEEAKNNQELVEVIDDLQRYLNKGRHLSLKGRPGIQRDWIKPTKFERMIHFYDGVPGVAPVRARELAKAFPSPMDIYQASVEDISKINGFGKPTAQKIHNFLRGIE